MDTLQCAVVLAKLERFDWELQRRREIGARYHRLLAPLQEMGLGLIAVRPGARKRLGPVHPCSCRSATACRQRCRPPAFRLPCTTPSRCITRAAYAEFCCPDCCPNSIAAAARVMSLPMSADLSEAEQDQVVAALAQALRALVTPGSRAAPAHGLRRATLTLLAGGALAQALPLLLGPWLTRLYSPQDYGAFHLFAAVATNLAVIACARYEFALPMARDAADADGLRRLCLRLLLAAGVLTGLGAARPGRCGLAMAGRCGSVRRWRWVARCRWRRCGPPRAQRFQALALARVLQYSGASLAQVAAGLLQAGVSGLVIAPIAAQLAATALLARRRAGEATAAPEAERQPLRDVARRWREFPLLNTPHAFIGALQDTVALALIAAVLGPAAAGFWGLALRYLKAPASLVGSAVSQALYPKLAAAGDGPTPAGLAAVRRVMGLLMLLALPLVLALWVGGPWLFGLLFWRHLA